MFYVIYSVYSLEKLRAMQQNIFTDIPLSPTSTVPTVNILYIQYTGHLFCSTYKTQMHRNLIVARSTNMQLGDLHLQKLLTDDRSVFEQFTEYCIVLCTAKFLYNGTPRRHICIV